MYNLYLLACLVLLHLSSCINNQKDAESHSAYIPTDYTLVWQDEFTSSSARDLPDENNWWYETGNNGWGNNEIQNYIPGFRDRDTCAIVSDDVLKIIAKKVGDEVLSVRMNTNESWKYGYFEARLRMPHGRGSWPAFWMMPRDFTTWPDDGEIDIVEYVGYRPDVVQSSIHTKRYNHMIGTEKTATKSIIDAENEFHIYALEWTDSFLKGFVDGEEYFHFNNDKQGNKETWPFDAPFYIKLNLAWGGNWGGLEGVDESKLPLVYEIDYVRVYQKK